MFGGSVGIGVSSTSALLDVAGGIRSSTSGAYAEFSAFSPATGYPKAIFLIGAGAPVNNTGLIVAPDDSSPGTPYPVEFSINTNKDPGDSTNRLVGIFQGTDYASIHSLGPNGQSAGTPLIFSTQNYYGTHPALFISNAANQNIGIGTSTPNYKLSIQDTTNPLQLVGLQTGTSTDQILSVDGSGVVRQVSASSLQSNLAFATNEEATTPNFITNWGASLSSFEYPDISLFLQGLTQRKVYPRGVYGQTSTQIAVRQGGVSTTATVVGGVIPAAAGSVVTVTFPAGYEPVTREGYKVYGTISGVYGVLTYNTGTISFTRSYTGSSVSVSSAPLVVDNGDLNSGYIIIWAGMNNYPYTTQVKSDIAAMISHLGHDNYLVLSLINTSTTNNQEDVARFNTLVQLNNDLAALYPDNYFDIRTYLIQNGLQDAGITPTAQDLIDIDKSVVPTSLRLDGIHLNSAGSKVVAEQVNKFLKNSTNNTNKILLTNNLESIMSSSASIGAVSVVNNSSLFSTGLIGGGYESDATSSIFLGERAGFQSTNSSNSNFFGQKAGQNTSSANYSNLFGYQAGMSFTGNNIGANNIIIGTNISLPNTASNSMNIGGVLFGTGFNSNISGNPLVTPVALGKIGIGTSTPGYRLTIVDTANPLQLVGLQTGTAADQILSVDANGVVRQILASSLGGGGGVALQYYAEPSSAPSVAPLVASGITGSIAIGDGARANGVNVNAMGTLAGSGTSVNATSSNFFGYGAGYNATNAYHSNFYGSGAGFQGTNAYYSNFFGINAGYNAPSADSSNFFGRRAGDSATNANNSNFFGLYAGRAASNASYSNLFGYQAGMSYTGNNIGPNNIIIGTNISLPNTASSSMNIGGVLFGTGFNSNVSSDPIIIPVVDGKIGILNVTPTYTLDVGNSAVSGIVARFTNSTGNCTINPTNTALACSSDMNLKKNITNLASGEDFVLASVDLDTNSNTLKKLNSLSPILYNWSVEEDGLPRHIGFIAQEVERIFGDLVSTDDNGMKAVNYIGFVPYLVQGIQEQTSLLNGNKDEIITQNNFDTILASIRGEEKQDVSQTFAERIQNGIDMLSDFVAARITAVKGYFEDIFAKNIETETLKTKVVCVEKNDGTEFCMTGEELENAFGGNVTTITNFSSGTETTTISTNPTNSTENNVASSTEETTLDTEVATSTEDIITNSETSSSTENIINTEDTTPALPLDTSSSTETTDTTTP
ncbi:hypothetical protein SDC9_33267 [bioreactor metagenome]|uniref:Peptidase S74 domain-containing protein n=1 Tax=bioreactor metagenome TaxID=1076179 RepID=A0A644V7T1_9ZZZZ